MYILVAANFFLAKIPSSKSFNTMKIVNLYSELQNNPRNVAVYRQVAEHYKSCNRHNEAQAFLELIERKYANSPSVDEEQRTDGGTGS